MLRLPCFATVIPAPAKTKADVVLMLKLFERSPPVPQLSMTFVNDNELNSDFPRITSTILAISSGVSPFIRNAVKKAAISVSEIFPVKQRFVASFISENVKRSEERRVGKECSD